MKPNDYAVVVGGSTMPVWLPELNAWVALIVGILSICYLVIKLWRLRK